MKLSYLYRNSYPQGAAQAFIIVVMNLIYRLYKQILYPLLAVLATASYSCVSAQVFNYDDSYPGVDYSSRPLDDRLTRLMAQVDAGEVTLEHDAEGRGYLDALLKALEINPASQVLVFSKTALKTRFVTAATPRVSSRTAARLRLRRWIQWWGRCFLIFPSALTSQ